MIELGNMSFNHAEHVKLERLSLGIVFIIGLPNLRTLKCGYGTLFFAKELVLSELPRLVTLSMDTTSLYRCESAQLFSRSESCLISRCFFALYHHDGSLSSKHPGEAVFKTEGGVYL